MLMVENEEKEVHVLFGPVALVNLPLLPYQPLMPIIGSITWMARHIPLNTE